MKIKLITILACFTLLVSCGDKWLGDVGPADGTIAPPEMLFESEQGTNNAVTGIYDLVRRFYPTDFTVTKGLKDQQLGYEYMGNDMVPNPGNWWTYESQWLSTISSVSGYLSQFHWYLFAKIIANTNGVIDGVTKSSSLSDSFKSKTIAEAKAIRGWALFQMSRSYSLAYTQINPATTLCVPIYTEMTTSATKGKPRSTVAEVFTQVLDDLSDVNIQQMQATPFESIYRADQHVAYAWRAQVHLEMGKWSEAAADAAKARQGFSLMSTDEYASGFNTINGEWIWAGPFKTDQTQGYDSFFSFADMTDGGYGTFFVNVDYVALFEDTDCRALFDQYGIGQWYDFGSTKFRMWPGSFLVGDYVYIRAAEMLLIEAECNARTGAETAGHNLLYELQKKRDPQAVKSSNTGSALIEEILVERRKEFYGEIGTEYLDLRRLGRPLVRSGNHPFKSVSVPANDKRWMFQIPQQEMDNNPNMVQNER